jgi:ABC-type transporter Mla subunit MlaD
VSEFKKSDLLRLLADSLDREAELTDVIARLADENEDLEEILRESEQAVQQRTSLLRRQIDGLQAELARRCNEVADLQYVIETSSSAGRRQPVQSPLSAEWLRSAVEERDGCGD